MPDIAWDILKQTDLKVAWRLAVKDMSKEFFSSQMVVVPHIEEASFYDLMVCFTKEKIGVLEKLTKVGPEYQLQGHISDLVRTTWRSFCTPASTPPRRTSRPPTTARPGVRRRRPSLWRCQV